MFEYGQFKHDQRGKNQACLTKDSQAGCHTRWRGLESHLLKQMFLLEFLISTLFELALGVRP